MPRLELKNVPNDIGIKQLRTDHKGWIYLCVGCGWIVKLKKKITDHVYFMRRTISPTTPYYYFTILSWTLVPNSIFSCLCFLLFPLFLSRTSCQGNYYSITQRTHISIMVELIGVSVINRFYSTNDYNCRTGAAEE